MSVPISYKGGVKWFVSFGNMEEVFESEAAMLKWFTSHQKLASEVWRIVKGVEVNRRRRKCGRDGCDRTIDDSRVTHKYCCDRCRNMAKCKRCYWKNKVVKVSERKCSRPACQKPICPPRRIDALFCSTSCQIKNRDRDKYRQYKQTWQSNVNENNQLAEVAKLESYVSEKLKQQGVTQ